MNTQSVNQLILQAALRARDDFLASRPHLRDYQEEIDQILDKSGQSSGRMAVLGTLMQGKLLEMSEKLYELAKVLQSTLPA